MAEITIGNRKIGDGHPTYIIAEMSANHAGSIERAKEIIHAAKEAGADCIKIQTYTPDTMTIDCDNEYFKIDKGLWKGENLYGLYQKAYTPWEWQNELKEEAKKVGIDFFSTPFDKTAVDFLEEIGIKFYKIASFELVDIPLIRYVASKGKPMILSTGMGSLDEIKDVIEAIESQGNYQYAFLKCSSAYPAISDEMNLATIVDMREKFKVPIGLSDHSMGSLGAVTAVAMGASIIEKHFCISREIENPDAAFSMNIEEFKQMVEDIRNTEKAKGVASYGVSEQEKGNVGFRRSIFVVKDIKKGECFDKTNIKIIRPGYGIKPKFYDCVLGKKASGDIKSGTPLSINMIDEKEIYLRTVTVEDMDLLYRWVNDPVCRQNYFTSHSITYEEHKEWFEKKIEDKNCNMFIACAYGVNLGQIRVELLEDVAEVSYSIDASYRGNGYGKFILNLVEKWLKENKKYIHNIVGRVKFNNSSSKRCFEYNGFKMIEKNEYIEFIKRI